MIARTEARSVGRTRKPIRVGLSCIPAEMSGMEPILAYVVGGSVSVDQQRLDAAVAAGTEQFDRAAGDRAGGSVARWQSAASAESVSASMAEFSTVRMRRPQARRTCAVVIGAPRRLLVRPQARRRCRL